MGTYGRNYTVNIDRVTMPADRLRELRGSSWNRWNEYTGSLHDVPMDPVDPVDVDAIRASLQEILGTAHQVAESSKREVVDLPIG